jgi:hypothetical protein
LPNWAERHRDIAAAPWGFSLSGDVVGPHHIVHFPIGGSSVDQLADNRVVGLEMSDGVAVEFVSQCATTGPLCRLVNDDFTSAETVIAVSSETESCPQ